MNAIVAELAHWAWPQVWQTTVVAVVALLLAALLRRRHPHLAHVVLLLVLVKCLTPPVWSSPLGVFSRTLSHDVPVRRASVEIMHGPIVSSTPAPPTRLDLPESPAIRLDDSVASLPSRTTTPDPFPLGAILLWTWAAGALGYASLVGILAFRHGRLIRRTSMPAAGPLADWHARLAREIVPRRRVRLWVSSEQHGPSCFGLVFPVVVVPKEMAQRLPQAEIEPVLAHELIHVRRGDTLVGLVQVLACASWWFHPLIWWASRQLSHQRERCCDVEVLATTGCDPTDYAQGMLNVLKFKRSPPAPLLVGGIHAADVTQERLESIMNRRGKLYSRTPWFCWVALLAGIVLLAPGSPYVSNAPAQPASPAESLAESNPKLPEFLDAQQRDYEDCANLQQALMVLKTKLADMGMQRYEALLTEESVRAAIETSIEGLEAENRRRVQQAADDKAATYARRTADFFHNVARPKYEAIAKDSAWPRGTYFRVSPAAEPGDQFSVNLQLDTRYLDLPEDELLLSPLGPTVGHAIPLIQLDYGFRPPLANDAFSLYAEFDDSVNSTDRATISNDFFAVPVTTELQRKLLSGPDVVAYVNINAFSFIDTESKTVNAESDVLPVVRTAMEKLSAGRIGGRLRVLVDYGTLRAGGRLPNVVEDLFRGMGNEAGFSQVDIHGRYNNDDGYRRKGFDQVANEGDADERARQVGNVLIYPVKTALSRYLAADVDCYFDVSGPVSLEALSIFTDEQSPVIEQTIRDLKLENKRTVRVHVQVEEPITPFEAPELPQAKKDSEFHRDAVELLKKAGFAEVRLIVQFGPTAVGSSYTSNAPVDPPRGDSEAGSKNGSENTPHDDQQSLDAIDRVRQLGARVDVVANLQAGESLAVTFSSGDITDEQLEIVTSISNLESLYVASSQVTDAGLEKLSDLKSLRKLWLITPQVTDAGLAHLRPLSELTLLVLSSEHVTSDGLAPLENLTNLQELQFLNTRIDDRGLTHLKRLGALERLQLNETNVTDQGLAHLKALTRLESLMLSSNENVRGSGLAELVDLPNLKTLWLFGPKFNDDSLRHVGRLTQLADFSMVETSITDAGLAHLRPLTALRRLSLPDLQITDDGVAQLAKLSGLQWLMVAGSRLDDASMRHLAGMKNLRYVDLSSTGVSDAGLAHIGQMEELRTLQLAYTNVTDVGANHLRGLRNLESLSLSGTKVTDAGMEHVGKLVNLRVLNLARSAIGDAGLQHLGRLALLESLQLRHTRVSDAGIEHLLPLAHLSQLDLTGTEIGDHGVSRLGQMASLRALVLTEGVADRAVAALKTNAPALRVTLVPKQVNGVFTSAWSEGDFFYAPPIAQATE